MNAEKALQTATHDASQRSSSEPASAPSNPPSVDMLARVWIAAQAIWGNKWTSVNGDMPIDDKGRLTITGAIWREGLRVLTEQQCETGLERLCRTGSDWPLSLPEFRRMAMGIPNLTTVSAEIARGGKSSGCSAFARLVWSFMDGYAYRCSSARDAERMLREAYERACEHLKAGGGLPPEPTGELEQDSKPTVPRIPPTVEERIARLEKVRRELDAQ